MKPSSLERFAFLDALRGLGALGVACYHIHRYRPLRDPVDSLLPAFVQTLLQYGWVGVPVFFVIAGFVTAYTLRKTVLTQAFVTNFTLRRIVRLGIPYWTTILFVVLVDGIARLLMADPTLADPIEWPQLAANLLFVQDILSQGNISAGTWFVCIDLQFGILFILLLWLYQSLASRCKTSQAARIILRTALFVPLGLFSLFLYTYCPKFNICQDFDAWIIYFFCMPAFGALAWWTLDDRLPRPIFWTYALIMVLILQLNWRLEVAIALGAGVGIYVIGRYKHLGDWLTAKWLQELGRISYSLFLIHYSVAWIVLTVGHWFTDDTPFMAILWLIVALAVSIIAAKIMYAYVEEPSVRLSNWLKNRSNKPPVLTKLSPPAEYAAE